MSSRTKTLQPWQPVAYDDAITNAIKALDAGVASSGQQQLALNWIVHVCAGAHTMSYRPGVDGDRDTAFAEGRRFVGNQILKQTLLRQTTPK